MINVIRKLITYNVIYFPICGKNGFDCGWVSCRHYCLVSSRKKLIGLDDLLTDHYKQKSKLVEKESKRAKAPKNYHSDEEEDTKAASLSRLVDECQNQAAHLPSYIMQLLLLFFVCFFSLVVI